MDKAVLCGWARAHASPGQGSCKFTPKFSHQEMWNHQESIKSRSVIMGYMTCIYARGESHDSELAYVAVGRETGGHRSFCGNAGDRS